MRATKISSESKIVAEVLTNLNGGLDVVHQRFAVNHKGFFTSVSTSHIKMDTRVYLSYTLESEKAKPLFNAAEKLNSLQYNGSSKVVNESGYTTRFSAIQGLDFLELDEKYLPNYSNKDLDGAITYGELGYLLTYASKMQDFPALGKFKIIDPRMKISVISVESTSDKRPEYRLGQYYTGKDFASYLKNLKEGSRPVPLPLYYGFMEYFGNKDVTLLGEVPRKVYLELVTSLKETS